MKALGQPWLFRSSAPLDPATRAQLSILLAATLALVGAKDVPFFGPAGLAIMGLIRLPAETRRTAVEVLGCAAVGALVGWAALASSPHAQRWAAWIATALMVGQWVIFEYAKRRRFAAKAAYRIALGAFIGIEFFAVLGR